MKDTDTEEEEANLDHKIIIKRLEEIFPDHTDWERKHVVQYIVISEKFKMVGPGGQEQ